MELTRIIRRPILTEKSNTLQQANTYTFEVDWAANKYQIKEAVEHIFQVKVASVNTLKVDKKYKRIGRFEGFTNRYKKAIVTLASGSINYYPEDLEQKQAEEAKAKAKEAKAQEQKAASKAKEAELEKKLAAKKATKTKAVSKNAETNSSKPATRVRKTSASTK